ncbi:MAG TPA: hypothetical protein VGR36_04750 [Candidatus Acidoferrales bacterium]|nr:hypothetical protein [Candidatus Acidoferrales bacterium]
MHSSLRIFALWLMVVPAIFGHSHHDDLAKDQAKFEKETDPVHKAKLMVKLGRAEFDEIEAQVASNNLTQATDGLKQYQSQVDSVSKALDATKRNAAKHAAGFLQLQVSVREALRRLNNILVGLTSDEQKPFRDVRDDLEDVNRHLMLELFPSQPQ